MYYPIRTTDHVIVILARYPLLQRKRAKEGRELIRRMRPGCLVRALKNESFPCLGFDCQGIKERIWQHCLFGSQEGWRGLNTFLPHQFKEKNTRTWRLRVIEPRSGTSQDWKSSTMTITPNGTTNARANFLAFDENREARRFYGGLPTTGADHQISSKYQKPPKTRAHQNICFQQTAYMARLELFKLQAAFCPF